MDASYMYDCYLKNWKAKVVGVKDGRFVVLDRTACYPRGGGQPNDTGIIRCADDEFKVIFAGKFEGQVSHEVDREGLKAGDEVDCGIDWERRHRLMRMHTASHILSGVFHNEAGAKITGNQLDMEKSRIDFNLDEFDREKIADYFAKSNEIVKQDMTITITNMPREEAMKDSTLFKLAKVLPPAVKEIRIVEIGNYDKQADGGTHVKSTSEVGTIEFVKAENKGKNNRRVYFTLTP